MTKEEIVLTLKLKKKFLEESIRERAIDFLDDDAVIMDDLLDLDMDKSPINCYGYEDMNNHCFDLGGWYYINDLLNDINNGIKV